MPTRYTRGAVVTRDHRFGVVWADDGVTMTIMPIEAPTVALRHDILLDLGQLVACGVGMMHATVRPQSAIQVRREGQVQTGTAPRDLQCLISQAVIRMSIEAQHVDKWAADSAHRARARAICR